MLEITQNDNGLSFIDQNDKVAGEKTWMVETLFVTAKPRPDGF